MTRSAMSHVRGRPVGPMVQPPLMRGKCIGFFAARAPSPAGGSACFKVSSMPSHKMMGIWGWLCKYADTCVTW